MKMKLSEEHAFAKLSAIEKALAGHKKRAEGLHVARRPRYARERGNDGVKCTPALS